jgi:glutathione S-transferase
MTDIILHHYETSPYSEKVRLGLGLKGLAWGSVEIPVIMPKPDLTALTGGYRKTPVLQIGADIYCDSQLIMRELERRHPTSSFYPAGHGAADALAWWAEKTTFSPAAGILFAKKPDALPEGFLEDRAKFSGRNIDPAADFVDDQLPLITRPKTLPRRTHATHSSICVTVEELAGNSRLTLKCASVSTVVVSPVRSTVLL